MIETLAIKAALGKAWDFLGTVPREVWYALGAVVAWWGFSSHYIDQGREQVLTELRQAEADAKEKAQEARAKADEKAEERAQNFEQKQDVLSEAIKKAEANNENSLDAIF